MFERGWAQGPRSRIEAAYRTVGRLRDAKQFLSLCNSLVRRTGNEGLFRPRMTRSVRELLRRGSPQIARLGAVGEVVSVPSEGGASLKSMPKNLRSIDRESRSFRLASMLEVIQRGSS